MKSRTKTFVMKQDPAELVLTPLDMTRYDELAEEMNEGQLVNVIMQSLQDYKAEREETVSGRPDWPLATAPHDGPLPERIATTE
mgnify:CR=1 FL=1